MTFREWMWILFVILLIVGASAFFIVVSVQGLILAPSPP
jgi:hypothetical protein